jgi:hypothetical protein
MKFLYVLVSTDQDFYFEQALVSIMSAKKWNSEIAISLLVDRETADSFTGKRASILKCIDEYKVIDVPSEFNEGIKKSRYLKTTMREHIDGDFLYVDVDTIWSGKIDENDFTDHIMGVDDGNVPLNYFDMKDYHLEIIKAIFGTEGIIKIINSGALFFKDSNEAHVFSKRWHANWLRSIKHFVFTDQQAFAYTNFELDNCVSSLPTKYNCQISFNLNHLHNAVLIHYFATSIGSSMPYLLQKHTFWQKLRSEMSDNELSLVIDNPKSQFELSPFKNSVTTTTIEFLKTTSAGLLMDWYVSKKRRGQRLFSSIEWIAKKIVRFYGK